MLLCAFLVFDKLCGSLTSTSILVIVSPLVALMKDQARLTEARRISAVYVGEVNDETESDLFFLAKTN